MSRPSALLILLFVLLSFRPESVACSMAGCLNNGDEMRPTFTILVTHRDKPLAGAHFHILAKGTEKFSATTDQAGRGSVKGLAPGEYWLRGDFLGTGVVYTCFHVSAHTSTSAKAELSYEWGDDAPATSRIAGTLVDSQPAKGGTPTWNLTHKVDVPIVGARLALRDPVTHAIYESTSDQEGHFSFEGLPNATYVLHIEGAKGSDETYDPTDSVIELTNGANRRELLFKGGPTGCGGKGLALDLFD